ncbi:MAG: hypothetical protein GY939_06240 [Actinomycetia bacterium]|nr:hypothetical protein [Actinomycetes bacterium]
MKRPGHGLAGRRLRLLLIVILMAASCSNPSSEQSSTGQAEEPVAVERASGGETDAEADPGIEAEASPPPVTISDRAELVENEECYDAETRCGIVLVPQVESSIELVGIPFWEWNGSESADPIVVLESRGIWGLDGRDFGDRPVLLLGDRDDWPGGPGLKCPALDNIEPGLSQDEMFDSPDKVFDAAVECRTWLENAGLHVDGATNQARTSDVANVITALGYDAVDIVATGGDAGIVAPLAKVISVNRAVYVNPLLPADVGGGNAADVLLDSLAEGWRQCEQAAACQPAAPINDLLALIEALDADPLPHPWSEEDVIDTADVVDGLFTFPRESRLIAALPEFHRALIERDAETVNEFLSFRFYDSTAHDLARSCQYDVPSPDGLGDTPLVLAEHLARRLSLARAACQGLGIEPAEHPKLLPALTIQTRSMSGWQASGNGIGPVITEPSVGWPTEGCLIAALTTYFDDGDIDDRACQAGMRFASPEDPIVPITASVFDGERTISLLVPEGWVNVGDGYWDRQTGIVDRTSLWVYAREADDPETVLEDELWEWDIIDPVRSTRTLDDRTWYIGQGPGYWGDSDQEVLAVSDFGDVQVVLWLTSEQALVDQMIGEVLEPAMGSVTLE